MPDLQDGESIEMQGSASKPYVIKNVGGVYSCSCAAWRNQSVPIEKRACKHTRKLRGDAAEEARIGGALPVRTKEPDAETEGPPLLLAERWDGNTDLAGWWMSEKLDGVRAYWTGKEFLSRQGNIYHAPDWFVAGLPSEPLDGELWLGRRMFQRAVSIVRRQDKNDLWKDIRFLIFDAPGEGQEFEARLEFVRQTIKKHQPLYAQAHEHVLCKDIDHLQQELARVENLGGEGLMLRQPGSKYEIGRSITLLKVKTFHDAEARVLGHEPGAGRHKGRLGALLVEMANGTRFSVGTGFSDVERERPPAVGSTITFRYQELSDGGVPRFPSYVGVRVEAPVSVQSKSPQLSEKKEASVPSTTTSRRFEFVEGASRKFWEVAINGTDVTVRFGRIGTTGQTQTKSFPDGAAATKHADKLIQEKTGKGYREASGS